VDILLECGSQLVKYNMCTT